MGLSFNKGDYGQFMEMVNTSKELLSDSILLRSIKEKVDNRLDDHKKSDDNKLTLLLILALSLPFLLVLVIAIVRYGISWRIVPALGLITYLVIYKILMNTPATESLHLPKEVHNDDPKPLKYLEMKVDYLASLAKIKKRNLELLRGFYMLFFPFSCYLVYEAIFKAPPFGNLLLGLFASFIVASVFWYYYFRKDLLKMEYDQNQLGEFKTLIAEQSK